MAGTRNGVACRSVSSVQQCSDHWPNAADTATTDPNGNAHSGFDRMEQAARVQCIAYMCIRIANCFFGQRLTDRCKSWKKVHGALVSSSGITDHIVASRAVARLAHDVKSSYTIAGSRSRRAAYFYAGSIYSSYLVSRAFHNDECRQERTSPPRTLHLSGMRPTHRKTKP